MYKVIIKCDLEDSERGEGIVGKRSSRVLSSHSCQSLKVSNGFTSTIPFQFCISYDMHRFLTESSLEIRS
jgi:hypothetical protein